MDLGFIILCPDRNIGGLRNTLVSIKNHSYNRESFAVVGSNATANEIKDIKELCPVHKGKETITSLINVGMKKMTHEWAFLMFSGSRVQTYVEKKVNTFAKTEKDILFPVVNRKCDFVSGSFDGVIINTKLFKQVGDFPDITLSKEDGINEFEMAKLFWCNAAIKKDAVFKAIIGLNVF
jgi:hypothetical protein